jgi:lipoprotein-anchoring transpeptidase ErfK/SrfK
MFAAAALAAALLTACASGSAPQRPSTSAAPPTSASTSLAAAAAPTTAPVVSAPPAAEIAVPKPPPPDHCASNTSPQLVLVKLDVQRMWLCARSRTVYSNAITSGMIGQYTETPTGRYHIQGRNTDTVLTLNTGATYDVKYWIPFDAPLFGFHDSSWQKFPYGSPQYKTDGSHGCIHMPLKAIEYLYHWADIGADVSIS